MTHINVTHLPALPLLLLAAALVTTAHAQPGCHGLGYTCSGGGHGNCCNPWFCSGKKVDCPHGLAPCCIPTRGKFDRAMLTAAKDAQEMVKAAEKPFFEALAEADEEERIERLAIEAQPPSEQTWAENVVNALFKNEKKDEATCEHTANACTANDQCCSKNCRCHLLMSQVCCAFPPGEDPEEENYNVRGGSNLRNDLD